VGRFVHLPQLPQRILLRVSLGQAAQEGISRLSRPAGAGVDSRRQACDFGHLRAGSLSSARSAGLTDIHSLLSTSAQAGSSALFETRRQARRQTLDRTGNAPSSCACYGIDRERSQTKWLG
jgi:hypothetical protein